MLLFTPHTQTQAKFLETGIIEKFMTTPTGDNVKQQHVIKFENNVYRVTLSDCLYLYIAFNDEFEVIDSDALIHAYTKSNHRQWISCLSGELLIHHMIQVEQSENAYFLFHPESRLFPKYLYFRGSDPLEMNDSIVIDADRVIGISGNPDTTNMFVVYREPEEGTVYYRQLSTQLEKKSLTSREITAFKKRLRVEINNIEAINRLQNSLKLP